MNKNQRGFTLVEALLLILVVSFIAFAGWYVWNSKNKTEEVQDKTSSSMEKNNSDSTADWVTFSDTDPKNAEYAGAASGGDSVPISFKHPKNWKTYPIGTPVMAGGSQAISGYNMLVPAGKTKDNGNISFDSIEIVGNLSAEEHFNKTKTENPVASGPEWEGVKAYTTKNGYSAHISKLTIVTGQYPGHSYNISVSNGKALANFTYGDNEAKFEKTILQIVDTLKFLE